MEESSPGAMTEATAKKTLLRIGWSTVGVGAGGAFVAAIVGGNNADAVSGWASGATASHRIATLIMLGGLVVVLMAYRVTRLSSGWFQRMTNQPIDLSKALLRLLKFLCVGTPALIGTIAVPWFLLVAIPDVLAGFAILCVSFSTPIVLTTVLVYGRDYWRTFCIGALFPASVFFLGIGFTYLSLVSRWSRATSFWHALDELGEAAHLAGFTWALILLSGLVAIGVRLLISRGPIGSSDAAPTESNERGQS